MGSMDHRSPPAVHPDSEQAKDLYSLAPVLGHLRIDLHTNDNEAIRTGFHEITQSRMPPESLYLQKFISNKNKIKMLFKFKV